MLELNSARYQSALSSSKRRTNSVLCHIARPDQQEQGTQLESARNQTVLDTYLTPCPAKAPSLQLGQAFLPGADYTALTQSSGDSRSLYIDRSNQEGRKCCSSAISPPLNLFCQCTERSVLMQCTRHRDTAGGGGSQLSIRS